MSSDIINKFLKRNDPVRTENTCSKCGTSVWVIATNESKEQTESAKAVCEICEPVSLWKIDYRKLKEKKTTQVGE